MKSKCYFVGLADIEYFHRDSTGIFPLTQVFCRFNGESEWIEKRNERNTFPVLPACTGSLHQFQSETAVTHLNGISAVLIAFRIKHYQFLLFVPFFG